MVLTVTINPLLEKRFTVESIQAGKTLRADSECFYAGGKGINVSRQLNKLGVKNQALLFAGGSNGKILRRILTEEQIDFSIVNTKSETRQASIIIENTPQRMTSIIGKNQELQKAEAEEFKTRLKKMMPNSSVVVFSGSSPDVLSDDIFSYGIKLANDLDKMVILDTYGRHLKSCLDNSPMVVHNNVDEIRTSLGIKLESHEDKIEFIRSLNDKGIKIVFLTDGKNATIASKFGFHYQINNPDITEADSTGSGDAMVAGIIYGLEKSMVFDEFAAYASALGAANALRLDACNVSPGEVTALLEKVNIMPIGKKMKIIDDSPTID